MKKTKKIFLCFTAIIALLITGCGNANNVESEKTQMDLSNETVYTANKENVKLLGRTYFDEDILYCALSGTGVEFRFTGTRCSITVKGDSGSADEGAKDNHARIGIYLNGDRIIDDMINESEKIYEVFNREEPEEAVVSVVKLSESPMSTLGIKEIKCVGSPIEPTENKDMLIEFVGDSITCGYGIDDPDKDHHFVTATEDVTKAYAYLTAKALDADYSMVSFSGYGIISGYTDNGKKVTAQTVPQFYTKLGYSWGQNGSFSPQNTEWDFSGRKPDLVVVNLGTNDDSYTQNDAEKQAEYSEKYTEFLKLIREKNPDARILCILGVMGDRLYPFVEKAVEDFTQQTGDGKISSFKLTPQSARDGYSADWHPSVKTHEKTAEKVAEEIKRLMN